LALQPRPEFRVVGEALDGLEAVQKAIDLQPDLVLLDIGLPKLNGIAAAGQIRTLLPHARLLFISLESSPYMVQEAFRSGGHGYVHKARAQFDLIPAVEAVLAGKQFVSNNLELSDSTGPQRRHEVQFYSKDSILLESATRFIVATLKANGSVVVFATAPHGESLVQRLKSEAFDVDQAIQQGTYISFDATEVISNMLSGRTGHSRDSEIVGDIIESTVAAAKARNARAAIFGECGALAWANGNTDAAIEMERKSNDLIETLGVDIFCAYPLNAFQKPDHTHAFKDICAKHTAVFSQ